MVTTGKQRGLPAGSGMRRCGPRGWSLPQGVAPAFFRWAPAAVLAMFFSSAGLLAQSRQAPPPTTPPSNNRPGGSMGSRAPFYQPDTNEPWVLEPPTVSPNVVEMNEAMTDEACDSWTDIGVLSPTVSAARLAVPGKASGEFQKACGAFRDKKYSQAEIHLQKAIELYPNYVAAWVVLGQVFTAQDRLDGARDACTRASHIDPNYIPPYLCLADLAATEDNWKQVAAISDHALSLDPVTNPYSLYYSADAQFHLDELSVAEARALAAVRLDKPHHIPQLHTLLARIYKAVGNVKAQAAQLREYLKVFPNAPDAAGVKSVLAGLDAEAPAH
jgi:hypothetical protein